MGRGPSLAAVAGAAVIWLAAGDEHNHRYEPGEEVRLASPCLLSSSLHDEATSLF